MDKVVCSIAQNSSLLCLSFILRLGASYVAPFVTSPVHMIAHLTENGVALCAATPDRISPAALNDGIPGIREPLSQLHHCSTMEGSA